MSEPSLTKRQATSPPLPRLAWKLPRKKVQMISNTINQEVKLCSKYEAPWGNVGADVQMLHPDVSKPVESIDVKPDSNHAASCKLCRLTVINNNLQTSFPKQLMQDKSHTMCMNIEENSIAAVNSTNLSNQNLNYDIEDFKDSFTDQEQPCSNDGATRPSLIDELIFSLESDLTIGELPSTELLFNSRDNLEVGFPTNAQTPKVADFVGIDASPSLGKDHLKSVEQCEITHERDWIEEQKNVCDVSLQSSGSQKETDSNENTSSNGEGTRMQVLHGSLEMPSDKSMFPEGAPHRNEPPTGVEEMRSKVRGPGETSGRGSQFREGGERHARMAPKVRRKVTGRKYKRRRLVEAVENGSTSDDSRKNGTTGVVRIRPRARRKRIRRSNASCTSS